VRSIFPGAECSRFPKEASEQLPPLPSQGLKFQNEITKKLNHINATIQNLKCFHGSQSQKVVLRCSTWLEICTQVKSLRGLLKAKRHHARMLPSRHQPPCHTCSMKRAWGQPHPEQRRPFGAREPRSCKHHAPPCSCVGQCEHDLHWDELGAESPTSHTHGSCPEEGTLIYPINSKPWKLFWS